MAALAEVFAKQLSQPLTDLYWDALKAWQIEEFQDAAKSWIRIGKHFPKPAELLERQKEMEAAAPKPEFNLPPADRKWLALVNGMFIKYLLKRRFEESYKGDINLLARRAECLSLVSFFEDLEAEGDEEATEAQMKIRFDRAMERIQDAPQAVAA